MVNLYMCKLRSTCFGGVLYFVEAIYNVLFLCFNCSNIYIVKFTIISVQFYLIKNIHIAV